MPSSLSLAKDKIHIVLFESISDSAVETLSAAGYTNVTRLAKSQSGDELTKTLSTAHIIGIRSRTHLTEDVIAAAPKLMGVGCFCIGTNQVDLPAAAMHGIPVFNAPHSNTRSVAELVVAETVMLYRGIADKSKHAHEGRWTKSASGSHEVRGKTLGIVGYGHIGSQVSVLAEAMGLRVVFFDIEKKLPLGNARQLDSLEALLAEADVVTLHVPAAPDTVSLMNRDRIAAMKPGAMLLNLSRGNVVDIDALAEALDGGHVGGAAVDVYPTEPKSNDEPFESPLRNKPNVILTPHIGGSTQEAQRNIGVEVATKLIRYSDQGNTMTAVNFPNIALAPHVDAHRLLHIHHNRPGVMHDINAIQAESGANILAQYLQTTQDIGYVVMDVNQEHGPDLRDRLERLGGTIKARILY